MLRAAGKKESSKKEKKVCSGRVSRTELGKGVSGKYTKKLKGTDSGVRQLATNPRTTASRTWNPKYGTSLRLYVPSGK